MIKLDRIQKHHSIPRRLPRRCRRAMLLRNRLFEAPRGVNGKRHVIQKRAEGRLSWKPMRVHDPTVVPLKVPLAGPHDEGKTSYVPTLTKSEQTRCLVCPSLPPSHFSSTSWSNPNSPIPKVRPLRTTMKRDSALVCVCAFVCVCVCVCCEK